MNDFNFEKYGEETQEISKTEKMKKHVTHNSIMNLPDILKINTNWIYSNEDGVPVTQDGKWFSYVKNPEKLMNLITAKNNNTNNYYYTLILKGDFLVIDLDDCIVDGVMSFWGQEVLDKILVEFKMQPYIEYSKSRKGLHVIFKTTESWNNLKSTVLKLKKLHSKYKDLSNDAGIDFLINKHPICLTGDIYKGYNPKELQDVSNNLKNYMKEFTNLAKKDIERTDINFQKSLLNNNLNESTLFNKIKSMVSMQQVFEYYGLDYEISHNILCPFPSHNHSKNTPSFRVYDISESWRCYGECNKSGDVIQFVADMEGLDRNIDACRRMKDIFKLDIDIKFNTNIDEEWVFVDEKDKLQVDLESLKNHILVEHKILNSKSIYMYNKGVYEELESQRLKKLISEHMPSNSFKHSKYVDEVYKSIVDREFIRFTEFNKNKFIVNTKNKILDFTDKDKMMIKEHDESYKSTIQCSYKYKEDKEVCPVFQKFLDTSLPPEQQDVMQQMMGYLLTLNTSAKSFFILYGAGDTGKSVFLSIISKLIGHHHVSAEPLQKFTDSDNKFATSFIEGKSVNLCADIPRKPIQDSALMKLLTGGTDDINIEAKGKQSYRTDLFTRFAFSANSLPASKDKSNEFFNRVIIIPFYNVCKEGDKIKNILDLFDYEYILKWAIEGLKKLRKNNFTFELYEENQSLVKRYKETDMPIVEFMKECIEVTNSKDDEIIQQDLLIYFQHYCEAYLANPEYGKKYKAKLLIAELEQKFQLKFSKNLKNPHTCTKSGRGFKGIKMSDEFIKGFNNYRSNSVAFN